MSTGRREQRGIVQLRELTGQRQPAVDALLEEGAMDRRIAFLVAHDEFVEVSAVEDWRGETRDLVDGPGEVLCASDVVGRDATQTVGAEDRQIRRRRDRKEGLVRADVRHRLLPPDVLLPGLERHAERPVTVRVPGEADHAPGHFPDVLLPAREDPQQRTAEIHRSPEGLAFSDHDVRAEIAGRPHDGLGDRIHAYDEDAFCGGPDLLELFLEATEEMRVLHVHAAHLGGEGLAQLCQVEHARLAVVLDFPNRDARSYEVGREDGTAVVAQSPRDEECLAAMQTVSHACSLTEGGRGVVHRGVGAVHPREFADEALILPQRLEETLAEFRLVRSIRRVELRARRDRSHARGDKVVVGAAAEERGHVDDGPIRGEDRGDARYDEVLRQPVRQIEPRNADRGRDVREEVLDAPQAHRPEHLIFVRGHPVSTERPKPLKDLESGRRAGAIPYLRGFLGGGDGVPYDRKSRMSRRSEPTATVAADANWIESL